MPIRGSAKTQSAGLLLFRRTEGNIEVLLGHPGGPFWQNKDQGCWTIPKGLTGAGEALECAAQREFAEETGYTPKAPRFRLAVRDNRAARSSMSGQSRTIGIRPGFAATSLR